MSITVHREITAEDVQQALTEALGPHYKVTVKSASLLRVSRSAANLANVHLSWSPGQTTFRVHGHGLIILRLVDALTITPKVRHALQQAFVQAA